MNESERYRLQQALTELIGAGPTETLMANLPPVPWTELATKADVARLGDGLRGEMGQLRSELRGEMGQLRSELRGEMGQLRADLRADLATGLADVRVELHDQLRINTWRLITAMGVFTGIFAAITQIG
jgi:hypothetical protein